MIRLETNSEHAVLRLDRYRCIPIAWGLSPIPARCGPGSISRCALSRFSVFHRVRPTVQSLFSTTNKSVGRIQLP